MLRSTVLCAPYARSQGQLQGAFQEALSAASGVHVAMKQEIIGLNMPKVDLWMPLYIGDYLSATTRLTTEQHGAYLLLIMDYWKNGPLPKDDAVLAQITRMSADAWSNARSIVLAFFEHGSEHYTHKRIDAEMAAAKVQKDKKVTKAKAAAAKRWSVNASSNAPSNACSNQQAMLEQCPSPSPITEAKASGGEPPKPLSPDEIIFGYGLPMLTNAGTAEKQARSFLGGLRKAHGDQSLIDKLRECLKEKPLQPLEWLAAALPPKASKQGGSRHSGFENIDYRAGITADGRF